MSKTPTKDALLWNKIAAALLVVLLVGVVGDLAGDALLGISENNHRDGAPAFAIDGGESATISMTTETLIPPIAPLMASADFANGQALFKRSCSACHQPTDILKIGPGMKEILGRSIASVSGFKYSKALLGLSDVWNYENLNSFLLKPSKYVKGTKMTFAGVRKASDRADIIAYLRTLSDSPLPLPVPEPPTSE